MTEHDEERRLERLFERTAAEPSTFEVTRMAARARELPTRLERVPRRLPRWTWAPAFAAVAALAALAVTLTQTLSPGGESGTPSANPPPAPVVPIVNAAEDPSALGSASAEEPSTAPEPSEDDLDALSLTPETDDDPFDLSVTEEKEVVQ